MRSAHHRLLLCLTCLAACDDDGAHVTDSVARRHPVQRVAADGSDADAPDTSPDTAVAPDTGPDTEPDTTVAPDTSPDTTGPDTIEPEADTVEADTTVEPDAAPALHPARYPADRIHSPITPALVERLRAIGAVDAALSDDVFMKVGASTTVASSFLKCFAGAAVDLGAHADLQPALSYFLEGDAGGSDPFSRTTLAAKVGVSAVWAISGDPSPLEAEYLATAPRFAFVSYGTNDLQLGTTHESALWGFGENLWTLLDDLLAWGVIPIVANIGHRLDSAEADAWVPTYNAVIAALAQGLQVPFIDVHRAYEPLPNHGISGDGVHGTVYPSGACRLTEDGLRYGLNMRNLQNLTALDRVIRGLRDGEALDPPGPALAGTGSRADPIVIDGLPFGDLRSTADSDSRVIDRYDGCAATADESGPERFYRLVVTSPVRVRATLHDRDGVDVDVHLLDESASAAGCLARAHRIIEADLAPGTYHFVLDSFVSGGDEQSGDYLFTLLALP